MLSSPTEHLVKFAEDDLRLRLKPGQRELLTSFETSGASRACWCCGRGSGKSLLSDIAALYDVTVRHDLREFLRPGEPRRSAVVAPTQDQALAHIRTIRDLIDSATPRIRRLLLDAKAETLTFVGDAEIKGMPCSSRGLRGYRFSSVLLDEMSFFNQASGSNSSDQEVWTAAFPATAVFQGRGWIIATSTPRHQEGTFWSLFQEGQRGSPGTHFWWAGTREMNPDGLTEEMAEQERDRDEAIYRREFLAEWISGSSAYLDPEDLNAATDHGRAKLQPRPGRHYVGACDPGFKQDSWALVIASKDDDGVVVVDGVWAWNRPNPEGVLDDVAALLRAYRVDDVVTDQFSEALVLSGLKRRGIRGHAKPWTQQSKLEAFGQVKTLLQMRALRLPDDVNLRRELTSLEAHPTPNGGTRIAAAGVAHDDRATSLAAAVAQLSIPHMSPDQVKRLSGLMDELREPVSREDRETRRGWSGLGMVGGDDRPSWPF